MQFYHDAFQLEVNFSALNIPKRVPGFTRLIVIAQGLTLKRVITVAQQNFAVDLSEPWKYFYGDEETRGTHDRVPIGFPGVLEKFLAVDFNYLYIKALQTHKRHGLWA